MPRTVAPLTDTAIRKAKAGPKPAKLRDGGGLYVQINPDGSRWWRWDYRRLVTGKRITLSLGTYPEVSLADARGRQAKPGVAGCWQRASTPGNSGRLEKAAGVEK